MKLSVSDARYEKGAAAGFLLVELMIAAVILVVALVTLLSLYMHAVVTVTFSEDDLLAKQKAREALESIYTARNTSQITFNQIANASGGGIFLDGPQPLREPGPDGLVGTADDGDLEVVREPGPDGIIGTGDDVMLDLLRFQREIVVQPGPAPDLKLITVRILFHTPARIDRTYEVTSYVSRYR
ncbi:MAG TPA: hypothetical protein PLM33_13980 [Acidobacteriota bacterium]|jgi:type II secretory pathway pseudopilin PulG|nr:hypothetical protein [Acidobacteriota bacterium]HRR26049.1 hypothetical protein [Acidobacteriota bacterium]HRR55761.1 hypothetical protein [Acidobacteriota bacterium]HRV07620.1 hypothetical protein [Acidobacteriota bacterium]